MFLGLILHRPSVRLLPPRRPRLRSRERQCRVCDGHGIVRVTSRGTARWSVCPSCGESDQD